MKKAFSLAFALVLAASSALFSAPFATAAGSAPWTGIVTTLHPGVQSAYKSQVNVAFRGFSYRLSRMGKSEAVRTLDALDAKISALLKKRLSQKNRFVLSYAQYLVGTERASVMARADDSSVPPAQTVPAPGNGPVYDYTDVVTRAAVTVSPQDQQGKIVVPFQEEEIGRFAVYAIGDVLTLTDVYVSNLWTATLDQHVLSVSLYDGSGSKLADGSLAWPNTVRFGTSLAIPKNTVANLAVRALFRNPNDGWSLGKTVSLQLGTLPWTLTTEGTSLGVRLVARASGQTVSATAAGSVASSPRLLARSRVSVSNVGVPSSQSNAFSLGNEGDGTAWLTRLYVDVNFRPSVAVSGWTLYKNREAPENAVAAGSGPVPVGSGSNPASITFPAPLELSPGSRTDFVLVVRTSGTPVVDWKRVFRLVDAEYANVSPSGSSVLISGLNRYPGTGFPTAESTYSY